MSPSPAGLRCARWPCQTAERDNSRNRSLKTVFKARRLCNIVMCGRHRCVLTISNERGELPRKEASPAHYLISQHDFIRKSCSISVDASVAMPQRIICFPSCDLMRERLAESSHASNGAIQAFVRWVRPILSPLDAAPTTRALVK